MNKWTSLTPQVLAIVQDKQTEKPFAESNRTDQAGTYLCRQCGQALFRSEYKFHSGCGWPSFDNEIEGRIKRLPDSDGHRTEILCMQCDAHLGHVFTGEAFTSRNIRYCVNLTSLDFTRDQTILNTEEAIVAGGCFWGVEYYFNRLEGVLKTEVGYTGGHVQNPSYERICGGNTGHLEAVRIIYDPKKLTYLDLLKYFFEIHDPTQKNGQGPDVGEQYLSAIFYYDETQLQTATDLIQALFTQGYVPATLLKSVVPFWPAEEMHQHYYHKHSQQPYCHFYTKRFKEN